MTATYPGRFVLNRLPADDEELWWTVYGLFGYRIPRQQVCPGHVSPFKAFADAYFARYPSMIWKASRGLGGKSRTLGVLGVTEATLLGCEVSILGGSSAQSLNVHDATKTAWDWHAAPKSLLAQPPTMYTTKLTHGGFLRTLTASTRSARGPHPPRLRLDEIDEMDQLVLDSALGQPMEQINYLGYRVPTQTVMSSTHQYPDKAMSEMIARAKAKGWPVYEWSVSQYTVVTTRRGDVEIQDLLLTDEVLTRDGWKAVQHVSRMGEREVLVLTMDDGRVLRCTGDHKIATPDGWVRAENLLVGDALVALPRSTALPAVSPVVAPGHVRVFRGELMPPQTRGLCDLCGDVRGAGHVHAMGDIFEMGRVRSNAQVDATHVANLPGDVANEDAPRQTVGTLLTKPADAPGADAVPVRIGGSVPEPVSVVRDGDAGHDVRLQVSDSVRLGAGPALPGLAVPGDGEATFGTCHVASIRSGVIMPVWDIGVEGTHEFVAEGVVVHNCYKETSNPIDGWLTQEGIERARSVVSQAMWDAEYDLQEPSFGGRAIDTDAVDRCFDPEYGVFPGDKMVISDPQPRRHYITAVDWAKQQDQTIISTFDTTDHPWLCVAWQKVNKMPWPQLVRIALKQYRMYGDKFVHDATGVGQFVNDQLREEMTTNEWSKTTGIVMGGGRERDAFYNDYIAAIEHDDIRYPRIEYAYGEHKYVTPEALFTSREHAPDSVVSGALAWSQRQKSVRVVSPGGMVRGSNPWVV